MTGGPATPDLLRDLAPRALGAVVRRYGHFADAEDAVQEALLAAATTWPADWTPDNPLAWLIRVASRKMADQYRRPVGRPGGGGGKQRLLHGVLRVGEVAVAPDDGAEGPRREVAQQVLGRRLAGHTSGSGALSTARTSMA